MTHIDCCPHCESSDFWGRRGGYSTGASAREPEKRYRCADCGETFATPATRERRHPTRLKGVAKRLDELGQQGDVEIRGGSS